MSLLTVELLNLINKNNIDLFNHIRDYHCANTCSWQDIIEEWNADDDIETTQYNIHEDDIDSENMIVVLLQGDMIVASYYKEVDYGNVTYYPIDLINIVDEYIQENILLDTDYEEDEYEEWEDGDEDVEDED